MTCEQTWEISDSIDIKIGEMDFGSFMLHLYYIYIIHTDDSIKMIVYIWKCNCY